MASNRQRIAAMALLLVALLLIPVAGEPADRLWKALQDLVHLPLFAALFLLLLRLKPGAWSPAGWQIAALVATVATDAAVEAVQPLVGRTAGWQDFALGVTGALLALLLVRASAARAGRRRAFRTLAVLLAAAALVSPASILADRQRAARDLPLLAGFESHAELGRWTINGCRIERVRGLATQGQYALRVTAEEGDYPGIFLADGPRNWLPFDGLRMDIVVPAGGCDGAWIRVDDRRDPDYEDRWQEFVPLAAGTNRIRIPRERMLRTPGGRAMNFADVRALGLFLERPARGTVFVADNIRLERVP